MTISKKSMRAAIYSKYTKKEISDELFKEVAIAIPHIVKQQDARTTALMKKMHIGFNHAARIMDVLHSIGVVTYLPKRAVLIKSYIKKF